MRYTITRSEASSLVKLTLNKNDKIKVIPGTTVYHTEGISWVETVDMYNIKEANENPKINTIQANSTNDNEQLALAPKTFGRIMKLPTGDKNYFLNVGVFLACDAGVSLLWEHNQKAKYPRTHGHGDILLNAFGDIQELMLDGTTPVMININQVLCWEESLEYQRIKAEGETGFISDYIDKFSGIGKIYIQTRDPKVMED